MGKKVKKENNLTYKSYLEALKKMRDENNKFRDTLKSIGVKEEDINKDVYVEAIEKGSKKGKDKKGIEVFPNTIENMKKELECARKVIEEYEKSQSKLKKQKAKIENSFVEMCDKINALMTKYTTKHGL